MPTSAPSPRLYFVLGDPVSHSRSPVIHNAAFRALGIDAAYGRLRTDAAAVPAIMRAIAAAGGGGNVTVPLKEAAAAALDAPSPAVQRIGACNTFWNVDGCLAGDNTDVQGFRAALTALGCSPHGARALLLGAGGAARAVAYSLLEDGASCVDVWNRTAARAHALRAHFGDTRLCVGEHASGEYDVVIDATSTSLASTHLPVALDRLNARAALDLNYATSHSPLLSWAKHRQIPAADGRIMLVEQAAAAFELWTGMAAPRAIMQAAIAASLA